MKFSAFLDGFKDFMNGCPSLEINEQSKIVFLSDLHLGDGGNGDDLKANRPLALAALRDWYLERGYTLVLGGDVEDPQKFPIERIREAWKDFYRILDEFDLRGRLWKLVGNHDLALLREKKRPYELHHGLRLLFGGRSLFCFHGHQASRFFSDYAYLGDFIVRYLARPLKIKNDSVSRDSRQRFKAERRIYRASKKLGIVSICGHTHRPLFESLSKYDRLRWTLEDLLREYPKADAERRRRIAELVGIYKVECERPRRKELRWGLSRGLYEEKSLLIPCLFNSGCATGKHGITALEIIDGKIALVHWTAEPEPRTYLVREALESTRAGEASRYVLQSSDLDHVFARIDLLGGEGAAPGSAAEASPIPQALAKGA